MKKWKEMSKAELSSTILLLCAIPVQITAIILFFAQKSRLGGLFLAVGSVLYCVGILVSRKQRKAEESVQATNATEAPETTETTETEENA